MEGSSLTLKNARMGAKNGWVLKNGCPQEWVPYKVEPPECLLR